MSKKGRLLIIFIVLLILGCKKVDEPVGPFISILAKKSFPINEQNSSAVISELTHDSCLILFIAQDDSNCTIIKINQELNVVWESEMIMEAYGIVDIIETSDHDFLATCFKRVEHPGYGEPRGYIKILKISKFGSQLWSKEYLKDQMISTRGISITETMYGNLFCLAGTIKDTTLLMKLNALGDSIWVKSYLLNETHFHHGSNEIIAGSNELFFTNGQLVLCTDLNGQEIWRGGGGRIGHKGLTSIQEGNNGEILVAGYNLYGKYFSSNILFMKYSRSGILEWIDTYESGIASSAAYSFCQSDAGSSILTGYCTSSSHQYETFIMKVDVNGDYIFSDGIPVLNSPNMGLKIFKLQDAYIVFSKENDNNPDSTLLTLVKFTELK